MMEREQRAPGLVCNAGLTGKKMALTQPMTPRNCKCQAQTFTSKSQGTEMGCGDAGGAGSFEGKGLVARWIAGVER